MTDRRTVMSWLEWLTWDDWPEWHSESEVQEIAKAALELLKWQEEIKEEFIEAFDTIRDAYNKPLYREQILLNYLLKNACCADDERK